MDYTKTARKITWTLFAAQSFGSAGLIAVATVSAIVGANLSNNASWAGLPMAIYLFGSAFAALLWGHAMGRIGRRGGMSLGLIIGVAGAAIAVGAIVAKSFTGFLAGLALLGAAQAALGLGRFAAAEVNPPAIRGQAISIVVLGGAVGAILGPLLIGQSGELAIKAGYDESAGAFLVTLVALGLGALMVFILLRPEPLDVGREISRLYPDPTLRADVARSIGEILRATAPRVAMVSMAFGQMVMVMVMAITSLHMKGHDHPLPTISVVISAHMVGMFAFSVISGRLADRLGRGPIILAGAGLLVISCLLATWSPQALPLSIALFLLGLGWNFCYVGGSSLLADHLSPLERAKTQGFNDLLIGMASALGSLGSGLVFSAVGFNLMGYIGAAASLLPFTLALGWQMSRARLAMAR